MLCILYQLKIQNALHKSKISKKLLSILKENENENDSGFKRVYCEKHIFKGIPQHKISSFYLRERGKVVLQTLVINLDFSADEKPIVSNIINQMDKITINIHEQIIWECDIKLLSLIETPKIIGNNMYINLPFKYLINYIDFEKLSYSNVRCELRLNDTKYINEISIIYSKQYDSYEREKSYSYQFTPNVQPLKEIHDEQEWTVTNVQQINEIHCENMMIYNVKQNVNHPRLTKGLFIQGDLLSIDSIEILRNGNDENIKYEKLTDHCKHLHQDLHYLSFNESSSFLDIDNNVSIPIQSIKICRNKNKNENENENENEGIKLYSVDHNEFSYCSGMGGLRYDFWPDLEI